MAVTTTPLSNPIGAAIVTDLDSDATGENNVRGAGSTVFQVDVDNTANVAPSYTKLYNAAAPVIGTSVPDFVLMTEAAKRTVHTLGLAGTLFGTALSFATVTVGGTAGIVSPTSDVPVRILCT